MNALDRQPELSKLLSRAWMLRVPDTKIHQISLSERKERPTSSKILDGHYLSNNINPVLGIKSSLNRLPHPSFYVVRDDLLHPLVNGNKARKLDALLPLLEDCSITDVVTCGGCQSAHAAAVAVCCAERGIKSHLLLRGERPKILTGYCLISSLFGDVTYVPRSVYAGRETMLAVHASLVAGNDGLVFSCNDIMDGRSSEREEGSHVRKVAVINEGASDVASLLGVFRLVKYLCQDHLLGQEKKVKLVVDAGTGTTAIGLRIAAACLSLPWEVTAVMLADKVDVYKKKEMDLISQFSKKFSFLVHGDGEGVHWIDRLTQRKFGKVVDGEVEMCSSIARQTGILVDPVYTLAAWEASTELCLGEEDDDAAVVMVHTGGTLGFFGLAQRYDSFFKKAEMSCDN